MSPAIVPIVEGHGEIEAVPVLLRRVFISMNVYDVQVAKPVRVQRKRVVKENELERRVQLVISTHNNVTGILVILDSDDDCPAELGPRLLERCKAVTHLPVAVVLANKEFECWFLGAKESLRGVRSIREDASAPPNPEEIRGAKERIRRNMESGSYVPTSDQPALAARMDLELAQRRCPSFDKFVRDVRRLISELNGHQGTSRKSSSGSRA